MVANYVINSVGNTKLPYNVIKIVYQTVRRITNRILGVKGLLRNRP